MSYVLKNKLSMAFNDQTPMSDVEMTYEFEQQLENMLALGLEEVTVSNAIYKPDKRMLAELDVVDLLDLMEKQS